MTSRRGVLKFMIVLMGGLIVLFVNGAFSDQGIMEDGPATLIFINGKIYTLVGAHGDKPGRIDEAIAIRGDRILATGSTRDMLRFRGDQTRVIDLKGAMVVPGLTDAHVHLAGLGRARRQLDLVGTTSVQDIQNRLKEYATKHPDLSWILGRGWDQNDWPIKKMPHRRDLDAVVSDRPVYLTRIDGHAAWANSRALEIAGITRDTPDPEGGRILRDAEGNPTGVLIDSAMNLVRSVIPEPTVEEVMDDLRAGARACAEVGLTSIHDAGIGWTQWQAYLRLTEHDPLPIRVYAMAGARSDLAESLIETGPIVGLGNHRLTLRAIKAYADGALGSRGAALLEPYSDEPDHRGLLMIDPDSFTDFVTRALKSRIQVNTHAIGDRANRVVLDAYEKAFQTAGCRDCRFRIEHAQHLTASDLPRFARLGVIPSMQPTHATSDMYWAEDRLGPERIRYSYAWKSLIRSGVVIAGGSDAPVESIDPRLGLYAAVTRQDLKGWPEGGWLPEQRVTRVEAILMFTRWAAYAAFEENLRGEIRPGLLADLTVFEKDLLTTDVREWPRARILYTVTGGSIVYSAVEK